MTIGIYCLTFSNGQKYIGQSNRIERRIGEHFDDMNGVHKNKKIRHAVYSCGLPTWEVLEECALASLNDREVHWIRYYDTYCNGLNMTIGGGYPRKNIPSSVTSSNIPEATSAWPVGLLITIAGLSALAAICAGWWFLVVFCIVLGYICLR